MENSDTFETADESTMDAGENICNFSAEEGESREEGGYIESKAPDFDDDSEDGFSDEKDKPPFDEHIMKFLDSITEKDEEDKKPDRPAPARQPVPRTQAEADQAIIASIPSERGRERIKTIMGARNEAEYRYRENLGVINNIKNFVEQVGVAPEEIVQNMEYSRLIGQGDEASLRVALDILEDQRDMICKQLNMDRPGVDLLSDFPDLKAAVERKEITLEHAARLAKYERNEREALREKEEKAVYDQENARFLHDLDQTKHAITSYLKTRSGEADHTFKVMRLHEHLSRPGVLQELTQNLDARRLFSQIRFMYDNIVVPPMREKPRMQPIRSRPTMQGSAGSRADASLMEKMSSILDGMGI